MSKQMIKRRSFLERDEPEALASPRLAINHDSSIDDAAVLTEVRLQLFRGNGRG